MLNIAEHVRAIADLKMQVCNHCMCARLVEDNAHYIVTYPDGFQVDGVRVSKGRGKIVALERLLVVMERHWKESFPGGLEGLK